jgi:hypothetical protein
MYSYSKKQLLGLFFKNQRLKKKHYKKQHFKKPVRSECSVVVQIVVAPIALAYVGQL